MIKYLDAICLVLICAVGISCGFLSSTVESASTGTTPSPSPGLTPSPTPGPTPVASASGYAFASGAANVEGATYKLRVRVGKFDNSSALDGTTYKIKTGKSRILNDM